MLISLWDLSIKIRVNPPKEIATKWPMGVYRTQQRHLGKDVDSSS